jgi:hypothetical protein
MGKYSNPFFSETTNIIKAKLYMNVHWMVLYNLYVFCSDMKFKMGFNQCNSFREEYISVFSPYGPVLILRPLVAAILDFRSA